MSFFIVSDPKCRIGNAQNAAKFHKFSNYTPRKEVLTNANERQLKEKLHQPKIIYEFHIIAH